MKKIMIVLDGVADRANKVLGGQTPLEYAKTPNLDELYKKSLSGTVQTIPEGLEIGSAVANLSLLGFDPTTYRGRAVIEAAGLNMPIDENDMYIRVNMVAFEGDSFEQSKIKSYSAYDISTAEAEPFAKKVAELYPDGYEMNYCGSFRNILIVKGGAKLYPVDFEAAHDIIGLPIAQYIKHEGVQEPFFELMGKSYDYLSKAGCKANGVWFWGASIMPEIKGDITGRVALSETLLMDGITKISGIPNIGTKRENRSYSDFLEEKLKNAIAAVDKYEDIYVHLQETDDLSHEMQPKEKAEAIEAFDTVFLERFLKAIPADATVKLASDHFTFSDTGAHGGAPVPFLYYNPAQNNNMQGRYTEKDCKRSGTVLNSRAFKSL